MGEDCGSCPHQWHIDGQPPDFNSVSAWWTQPYLGMHKHLSNYMDPWHETVAANTSFSVSTLAEPPQPRIGHTEPHGWFYCLPNFRHAMFPPPDFVNKKQSLIEPQANGKKDGNPATGPQFQQKQFLVFDQTGDQTTMIFSSGVGAPPMHYLSPWKKKQAGMSVFHPEQEGRKGPVIGKSDTILLDNFINTNEFDEDHEIDVQGDMHEDTEELNALMYSDDDTDGDDDEDEVTSTGHSPSTLTSNEKHYELTGIREEVASSDEEPTKRRKLFHGGNGISQTEGLITLNCGTFGFDDVTESHYVRVCDSGKTTSLSGKKRARKDLVRETVRTLQSMIPDGKGVTAIEVIDEAINFLLSLKRKAYSLGYDSM
uniref:BHLH domain-containing protein n=1 Tax=Kalanchoe fedtschenkoi TaxID=63787 RepID=A0A7N0UL43_KALFE